MEPLWLLKWGLWGAKGAKLSPKVSYSNPFGNPASPTFMFWCPGRPWDTILARFWRPNLVVLASWAAFGACWAGFRASWAAFGRSWAAFWVSLATFGAYWAAFGTSWAHLGASLGRLGVVCGSFWERLGVSWGVLGHFCTPHKRKM